jgi:hypothetical protein
MVKTRKTSSSSPGSKRKGKGGSRVHNKSGKVNSQKRKRRTTTKISSKATGRSRTKKRTKTSEIIIKRTSGRREKFQTDKMAQTVSRSGTPFLLAREVAKTVSEKVMSRGNRDTTTSSAGEKERISSPPTIVVDGGEIRKNEGESTTT